MALEAHMDTLNQRHQELETAITDESKHPAHNDIQLLEMKRQKLRLKDQIEEIRIQMKPN